MSAESNRQQPSGFGTFVWALFFFFVFTLIVIVGVSWNKKAATYEDERAEFRTSKRIDRAKADEEDLKSVAWIDEPKGIVRLPIADAKRLVIEQLKTKKPAPTSVPLDPRLPKPVYDPAAGEPASPPLPSAPQGSDTVYFPNLSAAEAPASGPAKAANPKADQSAPEAGDRPPLLNQAANPKTDSK